jgi:hypothetical protein
MDMEKPGAELTLGNIRMEVLKSQVLTYQEPRDHGRVSSGVEGYGGHGGGGGGDGVHASSE